MRRITAALAACSIGLLVGGTAVRGQGVLVAHRGGIRLPRPIISPRPEPTTRYRVKEVDVSARIEHQSAVVRVDQTFVNEGDRQIEAQFVFPIPHGAAVEELTLMIDGVEHPANLLPADEARRRYEEIVRKSRDPALMEWIGCGLVQTSVFPIPAGAERTVSLRYTTLCRSDAGVVEFLAPLRGARYSTSPIERLHASVTIVGDSALKNIYSPSHEVEIDRTGDRRATVSFTESHVVPEEDFRLFFDFAEQPLSMRLLSYRPEGDADGYFLLLGNPQIDPADDEPQPKTVIFVLDRSGSMAGKKIEQAQAALQFVLNNLREGDLFNIVAYDSVVDAYAAELQRFNEKTASEARQFVESIRAGGGTNIHEAVTRALESAGDSGRPTYVVFLTDGLPTAGETDESRIAEAAEAANRAHARLFTFGVGFDVNSRLLDRLAREGSGVSHYVRPNDDIETEVAKLYGRIESPVLYDASLEISVGTRGSTAVNRLYPQSICDLFAGQQLVISGRYAHAGRARIVLSGKVGDETRRFEFEEELAKVDASSRYAFVEKLWAVRRIGDLVDQLDLHGENQELVDELVALSTKHGILTPYTSFLAEENVRLQDVTGNAATARDRLRTSLDRASGRYAFEQRELKNDLQYATRPGAFGGGGYGGGLADGYGRRLRRIELSAQATPAVADAVGRGAEAAYGGATAEVAASPATLQLGRKAFYRRGEVWEDAELTEAQRRRITRIERFSKEYFELADRFGDQAAQVLALDDAAIVVLGGRAYELAAE